MIAVKSDHYLNPDEYLAMELESQIKHEYIDGEVYAMAGTSKDHNLIVGNLYLLLRNALQNSPCRTYFTDLKVRIEQGRRFFYPDLLVNCDPNDDRTLHYVDQPQVIIEILSPSTESFDRGEKFQCYRKISSLQDYVLVSSQAYMVEVFHRVEGERWLLSTYAGIEAIASIESLNLNAPLSEIYATLDLTPKEDNHSS
ncbi:Uma2 family endonuclease [Spirulina sp. CCNP1310]|uniref:Uma2 family endonuclease n=1 Tax=Spirulina sp. CCNP1310 TaxID=3110249 RepID=UPI002B205DBD|nr:Uma2 family endonuclease [Spirulina sp. CCNP1310]MEA5420386.1 Uma2 family endonuclease [Spirulina sp. CCNP1310]